MRKPAEASNLSADVLKSKTLLSLDSEEKAISMWMLGRRNAFGSGTGADSAGASMIAAELKVTGLEGRHSGTRSTRTAGTPLKSSPGCFNPFRSSAFASRRSRVNKHNAMPREASALIYVPKKA
jgi:hypothetical protein